MDEIIETIHSFYDSCAPWWSWNTLVDDDMIWPTLWYSQQQYYLTVSRSLPQCTMQNTMNFYKKCFVLSFISCHVFCFWYKQAQNDHVQCKESSYPSFMAVHGIICLWVFKNNGNEWLKRDCWLVVMLNTTWVTQYIHMLSTSHSVTEFQSSGSYIKIILTFTFLSHLEKLLTCVFVL